MYGEMPYTPSMKRGAKNTSVAMRDRRRPAKAERKRERLELRIAPSAKALIQRAMAVTGLTAGDLAYEAARRAIEEHERMLLTGSDRDVFLEAVSDPPAPSKKLVAALKRHRELFG